MAGLTHSALRGQSGSNDRNKSWLQKLKFSFWYGSCGDIFDIFLIAICQCAEYWLEIPHEKDNIMSLIMIRSLFFNYHFFQILCFNQVLDTWSTHTHLWWSWTVGQRCQHCLSLQQVILNQHINMIVTFNQHLILPDIFTEPQD